MGLFSTDREYLEGQALANNPALMKLYLARLEAEDMSGVVKNTYGQAAQPEVQAPYQQSESETFPGEQPLPGLTDVVQEAQAGYGLIGRAGSPAEQRYLQAQRDLGGAGVPQGLAQQAKLLGQMQNSVMSNEGSFNRDRASESAKMANPQLRRSESELEFAQRDPVGYREWQALKKVPTTRIVNDLGNKVRNSDQQIAYDDVMDAAKSRRAYISDVVSSGRGARQDIIKTQRMLDILDKGVKTGFGQDWVVKGKQVLQTMGVDSKTADAEELQTLMGDLVMKRVAETKGAVSEREMALFKEYSANFGKSPEGNRVIINFYKSMLERSKDMSRMVRKLRKAGVSSLDIEERLLKYQDENPLAIKVPKSAKDKKGQGHPPPPVVGEVQQGYRFLGGDPGKKASWRQVK